MRILVYFMHAETLGETQRVKSIAGYLGKKHEVLVVNAGVKMDLGNCKSVQLPNPFYNKENHKTQAFQTIPPSLIKERAIALLRVAKEFAPDVVVTKSFPFQYPELKYELLPLIKFAKVSGAKLVCSLGYPLGTVSPSMVSDTLDKFDWIMVHCPKDLDPEYIDSYYGGEASNTYLLESDKVTFTGYVLPEESIDAFSKFNSKLEHGVHREGSTSVQQVGSTSAQQVLISRGSGVVNDEMLMPSIEAVLELGYRCVVVNGLVGEDHLREEIETKFSEEISSGKLVVHQHLNQEEYTKALLESKYSISTCGYGTGLQLLYTRKPGILIPKLIDKEQWYRAEMLGEILGSKSLNNPQKEDIKEALQSLKPVDKVKEEWFGGLEKTEEVIENVGNN